MKKIIAAATLATVLASPALAQSYDPDIGSGNVGRSTYSHWAHGAYHAFARVNHAVSNRHYRHFRH